MSADARSSSAGAEREAETETETETEAEAEAEAETEAETETETETEAETSRRPALTVPVPDSSEAEAEAETVAEAETEAEAETDRASPTANARRGGVYPLPAPASVNSPRSSAPTATPSAPRRSEAEARAAGERWPPRPPVPPELQRGYSTADLPPVPGSIRVEPEDFQVEEVPLYPPAGEGTHLFLRVEKRGIPTDEAVRRLARRLGVPRQAIGSAGLKDARATTVQTISVPAPWRALALDALADEQMRVLEAVPHRNKLKVGHLAGNRFRIRVRGGGPGLETARAVLARLEARGVANYFGLQRFGRTRTTQRLGRALVEEDAPAFVRLLLFGGADVDASGRARGERQVEAGAGSLTAVAAGGDAPDPGGDDRLVAARAAAARGDYAEALQLFPRAFAPELAVCRALFKGGGAEQALRAVAFKQRVFYVSAFQSLLFNAYLSRRLERLHLLEAGEVATLHRNNASFVVEDPAAEQGRCDALEISPSGPSFGKRLLRPTEGSGPWRDEEAVLAELAPGLGAELTRALGVKPLGQRRLLRIPLQETRVEPDGFADGRPDRPQDLVISFFLPRGCYATSVLEELFKRQTD